MSNVPKILRSWGQGGLEEAEAKERFRREAIEAALPPSSVSPGQQIVFFGHTQTGVHRSVVALAGAGAPTPTGGWPKVAEVSRFQRLSFTIPEGYDPYTLNVPVQFEAVKLVKGRKDLEQDIINLEWMAGRSPNPPGGETKGEPPFVEIYTVNAEAVEIPLVPLQFQGQPGKSRQWYITAIDFDPNPERDFSGVRLRQRATVTLKEIVSTPSAVQRNREAREEVKGKYKTFVSTQATNTIRRIAVAEHIKDAWQAILEANPRIGSPEKILRVGTRVKIPLTAFRQVPR